MFGLSMFGVSKYVTILDFSFCGYIIFVTSLWNSEIQMMEFEPYLNLVSFLIVIIKHCDIVTTSAKVNSKLLQERWVNLENKW